MKEFQICGLGNAVVDIFLEVSDAEFASLGFERGGMRLVDHGEQKDLLERYQKNEPKLVSGGSVANSIIAFSQLGGKAAFIGCVGDESLRPLLCQRTVGAGNRNRLSDLVYFELRELRRRDQWQWPIPDGPRLK